MSKPKTPAQILKAIGKIHRMELGSMKPRKKRGGKILESCNLYTYEYSPKEGKKRTRTEYVAACDVPAVEKQTAAGDRFCDLVEQYAKLIIASTRREREAIKKRRKEKKMMPTEHIERPIKVVGVRVRIDQAIPPQVPSPNPG